MAPTAGRATAPHQLLSYFTELSNTMVAIISTLLARRARQAWGGPRTCARSLMITVTAIVTATSLAPIRGLSATHRHQPLQHISRPFAFVGTAAFAGPRGVCWQDRPY